MGMMMNVAWLVGLVYTNYEAARDAADEAIDFQLAMCRCYCMERAAGADCRHMYNVEAIQEAFESEWHTNDAHVVARDNHLWEAAEAERRAEARARDQALWDAGEIPF